MSRKSKRNQPGTEHRDSRAKPATGARRFSRIGGIIAAVAAGLLVIGVGTLLLKSNGSPTGTPADASSATALASDQAPTLGDTNAKVHVVEFLDPACETCAVFYPLVKQLVAENPGRVRVSIRHIALHEGSNYVIRVLEASRKQDKYWPTMEALLASQSIWAPHHTVQPALVLQAITDVGLNMAQLMTDMNAPDVTQRVEQDRNDAIALQVTATPEFYVNGRPLPGFGDQQLLSLVREELQKAY